MKMATDNLKNAAEQRLAARTKYIEERVQALPANLQSLSENELRELVKQFHKQLAQTEEARYDFEMKIRKQDYDINELTIKVNDAKGKFIKPALKKVSKTSHKYKKFEVMIVIDLNLKMKIKSIFVIKFN